MAELFLLETRIMSYVSAPKEWALCDGQLLFINQNQAFFSLPAITFGGDKRVNLAPPDIARPRSDSHRQPVTLWTKRMARAYSYRAQ